MVKYKMIIAKKAMKLKIKSMQTIRNKGRSPEEKKCIISGIVRITSPPFGQLVHFFPTSKLITKITIQIYRVLTAPPRPQWRTLAPEAIQFESPCRASSETKIAKHYVSIEIWTSYFIIHN